VRRGKTMAYVFDLDANLDEVIIDAQGVEIVEFALGYDLDSLTTILMSVTLAPMGDGVCDLRFGIREQPMIRRWETSALDYTREKVQECVPKHARSDVLDLILAAVGMLAAMTKHNKITMETHYQHLDDEALKKYRKIAKALENNSFNESDAFRNSEGTDYWLFSKV
jgi:hypothetical protein